MNESTGQGWSRVSQCNFKGLVLVSLIGTRHSIYVSSIKIKHLDFFSLIYLSCPICPQERAFIMLENCLSKISKLKWLWNQTQKTMDVKVKYCLYVDSLNHIGIILNFMLFWVLLIETLQFKYCMFWISAPGSMWACRMVRLAWTPDQTNILTYLLTYLLTYVPM